MNRKENSVARSEVWIAVYTRPHWERTVASQLQSVGIECYVPIRKEVRQVSDRKKIIELPLLPSYVLVHLNPSEYRSIYQASGIIRLVMFRGRIAIVQQAEIEVLRQVERSKEVVEISSELFYLNEEVQIVAGAFSGHRGKFIRSDGSCRVSLQIEELGLSVVVELPMSSVQCISHKLAEAA